MSALLSTPDRVIARIAASQHGHVTRSQLLDAGFDRNAIAHRVRTGRLVRRHRGVYAVGHPPPSPHARAMAAVLACGRGAALSHRAAALWGLTRWPQPWRSPPPPTAAWRGSAPTARGTSDRVTTHYGIPTTTPARTLLDLAPILAPASLTRAVNDARLRHLVSLDDLHPAITRRLDLGRTEASTRSVFEDAFLAFVDRLGLPRPEVNQRVAATRSTCCGDPSGWWPSSTAAPTTRTSSGTASATPTCWPPACASCV